MMKTRTIKVKSIKNEEMIMPVRIMKIITAEMTVIIIMMII